MVTKTPAEETQNVIDLWVNGTSKTFTLYKRSLCVV